MKVREVMTAEVVTVQSHAMFQDIVGLMVAHGVTGVPVVDGHGSLRGIVTEADVMSKEAFGAGHRGPFAALRGFLSGTARWTRKAVGVTAEQLMTTGVIVADPEEHVGAAARRMLVCGVKQLPVLERGRVVGVVARRDVLMIFHHTERDVAS